MPDLESIKRCEKHRPFWVAGPCILEDRKTTGQIADHLKGLSLRYQIPIIFKASFDKANRTSHQSYRGPGLEAGLRELEWVRNEFDLPILTDIHEASQARAAGDVVDIIQIPAFLCRQTDLLKAACETKKWINVKKGQFLAPSNVKQLIQKLEEFEATRFWITERGSSFGYQRLVVDFAGFVEMEKLGANLILDITHSVQLPGADGNTTGAIREAIPLLAKAGAAVGVSGFFAEIHPEPSQAKSDASSCWKLSEFETLLRSVQEIAGVSHPVDNL